MGIMSKLISETLELNQYLYKLQLKCSITETIPSSPLCNFCHQIESTHHFLMTCKKYTRQTTTLFNNLSKINHKFKYKNSDPWNTSHFLIYYTKMIPINKFYHGMKYSVIQNQPKDLKTFITVFETIKSNVCNFLESVNCV